MQYKIVDFTALFYESTHSFMVGYGFIGFNNVSDDHSAVASVIAGKELKLFE